MNAIEKTKQLRDIAIEGAFSDLIKTLNPYITRYDIQKKAKLHVIEGSGEYTLTFDDKPLVKVTLVNMVTFTFEILS